MTDDALLTESLLTVLEPVLTLFVALALAMARPLPVLIILPVFTRLQLTGLIRNAVVMALALPMLIPAHAAIADRPIDATMLALLGKEIVAGIILGTVFSIPFYGAEAAGRYLDFQRGASEGSLVDPMTQAEESLTGSMLTMVLLALFYGLGGLAVVTGGLYASYRLWPIDALLPELSAATPELLFGLLDRMVWFGLVLGGPVLIVLLLGDLLLAVMTKFAPQINAFDMSMSVKGALFVIAMPIYLVFLLDYLGETLEPVEVVLERMRSFAP